MSYPKLSMRQIRRHPAVITDATELQPGMDVALCHLMKPIGKVERCAQALISLVPETGEEKAGIGMFAAMKKGYKHTPTWGIVIEDVATIDWVNTTNPMWRNPYASFRVTRSAHELGNADRLNVRVTDVEQIPTCVPMLPEVLFYDHNGNMGNEIQKIVGFENLGLAEDLYKLNQFVVNLSALPAVKA